MASKPHPARSQSAALYSVPPWTQARLRGSNRPGSDGTDKPAPSPGGTGSTGVFKNQPQWMQLLLTWVLVPLMELVGKVHAVDVAVDRYFAPLEWSGDKNGQFWASKPGTGHAVGPMERMTHPHLLDTEAQEALWSTLVAVTGSDVRASRLVERAG